MGIAGSVNAGGILRRAQAVLRHGVFRLGCAAALGCGWSSQLNGQQIDFRQQAGLYLPTRLSFQHGALDLRQKIGLKVGARLTLTFNQRFAVVTGVTYIPGYALVRAAGKQIEVATGSHLLTAAIGAQYWLLARARRLSWEIHSGVGVASGGERYKDLFQSSTVSGFLGTILGYQIGQIVSLQLRIQQRLYRIHLGSEESGHASKPLRISFGLGFPFLQSALQKPQVWR